MKTKKMNQQGFTLIELLVVIAIIAILASVSVPALQTAQVKAKQNKAMQQAIGIAKSLRAWSLSEDGAYPTGENANEVFATMLEDDGGKEDVFYVSGSAWHGKGQFKGGPDGEIGAEEDGGGGRALEPGENHWAFNIEASAESDAKLALIADGFSTQVGTYASVKSELGGIWKGKDAIVVYCDASGGIEKLNQSYKFVNKKTQRDEFEREGVEMVNPATPAG